MSVSPLPTIEALAAIKAASILAERRKGRATEAAPAVKASPPDRLPPIACGTCNRNAAQMKALRDERFECSHVDCRNRRHLTAAPSDVPPLGWFHAGADD